MRSARTRRRIAPAPRAALLAAVAAALWPATPAAQPALPSVTVTAGPLDADEPHALRPVTELRGAALDSARETSLGATLSRQPGVHDSGFGTAAGRPVVRGFDGARVGISDNGLELTDVSALSPDHAVAIDPLSARGIRILRGPATLRHGSGMVGGLIDVVTDRIPASRISGLHGDALASGESASSGHAAALRLRGGGAGWNWTADALHRRAGDYRIPAPAVRGDPESADHRLPNSFTRGEAASAGVSYVGSRGLVGAAVSDLSHRYGIPTEPDAFIRMDRRRVEALAELDAPFAGFARMRLRWADGRYRHDEVEGAGAEVGTAFRNRGRDTQLELVHLPLAGVSGVLGVQLRERSLASSGEEAYLPGVERREQGFFYVGERAFGTARIDFGLRADRSRLDPDEAGAERRFSVRSASLGATLPLARSHALVASLTSAQRAPALEELYAGGPHAATATWEIGDPNLRPERSTGVELALHGLDQALRWRVGIYSNRFANYVHALATDENGDGFADRVDEDNRIVNGPDDPGAGEFTRLAYRQGRARFHGLEAEIVWQPPGSPFSLRGFADLARGSIEGVGNVPRMAPARIGGSIGYRRHAWSGFVAVISTRRQDRVATLETATAGHTRVDAEIAWTPHASAAGGTTLFLQARNLLDAEIRLHTSFVKDAAPQPGRSLLAGVRSRF